MAEKKKETKVQKFRLLKNPKQESLMQVYYVDGNAINVPKTGYYFSMDKSMDKVIEALKKDFGFVEAK